ncbi:hypothetical protein Y032_0454g1729 [Ancylostoma ceylanicum]|uniref:WAP domain-containing protein n=1 Tax=Ancylostoma ceylanicum TaxID=53326 RepID=A0A016WZH1_9BILA|nr:hypothetical protein Y032_0454g1729 [Ancylostoma ceylanicum]
MIVLVLALIPICLAQKMSLCEYFERLGVDRPECRPYSSLPHNTFHQLATHYDEPRTNAVVASTMLAALPLCMNYFHSCMPSTACESGTICTSGVDAGSCCTNPIRTMCPSPTSMNVQCRKIRGVNWCDSDYDCHGTSTMPSICCPTGCNYNMCIRLGGTPSVPHVRRHIIAFSSLPGEETCPDPYTLNLRCIVRRPTGWCLTDAECPSVNSIHPRKCCPTVCGYNACLIKYNGKWMVA